MVIVKKALSLAAVPLLTIVGLGACSSAPSTPSALSQPGSTPVVMHAAGDFPWGSLTDWVSYADQVSVVKVLRDERMPSPKEDIERGEGYVGRMATMKVERTIWSAPGSGPKVEKEKEISFSVPGWVMHDRQLSPAVMDGSTMEVGKRYLVPLLLLEEGWSPQAVGAAHLLKSDDKVEPNRTDIDKDVAGKSVDELETELAKTEPDPTAKKYSHLRGRERSRAVAKESSEAFKAQEDACHAKGMEISIKRECIPRSSVFGTPDGKGK